MAQISKERFKGFLRGVSQHGRRQARRKTLKALESSDLFHIPNLKVVGAGRCIPDDKIIEKIESLRTPSFAQEQTRREIQKEEHEISKLNTHIERLSKRLKLRDSYYEDISKDMSEMKSKMDKIINVQSEERSQRLMSKKKKLMEIDLAIEKFEKRLGQVSNRYRQDAVSGLEDKIKRLKAMHAKISLEPQQKEVEQAIENTDFIQDIKVKEGISGMDFAKDKRAKIASEATIKLKEDLRRLKEEIEEQSTDLDLPDILPEGEKEPDLPHPIPLISYQGKRTMPDIPLPPKKEEPKGFFELLKQFFHIKKANA